MPVALALVLAAAPGPSPAQTDLLKRGNDFLQGLQRGGSSAPSIALSNSEIGAGLREALKVGVDAVATQLGTLDGFNGDPKVHIPLPDSLATARHALARIGMSEMADDLELRLNRAAEAAAPEARDVFFQAIEQMSWDDVRGILDGPDDAATRYLERTMSAPLAERMRPIVDGHLAEVGALRSYDRFVGRYETIPFVPDARANLTRHVLDYALKGIFTYLGEEEAAIRHDPAKRTTELLRKVFAR